MTAAERTTKIDSLAVAGCSGVRVHPSSVADATSSPPPRSSPRTATTVPSGGRSPAACGGRTPPLEHLIEVYRHRDETEDPVHRGTSARAQQAAAQRELLRALPAIHRPAAWLRGQHPHRNSSPAHR
jgi:hypothetical protein